MSDSLDRRTVLKGAAATVARQRDQRSRGRRRARRTHLRRPGGVLLRSLQGAGARKGARPLHAPAPSRARHRPEDQLRGMGENQLPLRPRAVRRRARPLPRHLFPSRPLFPEGGRRLRRRGRPVARRSFTTSPISTCRPNSVARGLPKGAGFAGMRIQEARDGALDWRKNDWVAFLGAAYFRAIGELHQYGLSARGVALDVAVADRSEEFPDFTQFYVDSQRERGHADRLRADGGALDRRRLSLRAQARQGRDHGHRV